MHDQELKGPTQEDPQNQGFETRDIPAKVISKVGIGFMSFAIGCTILGWLIYYYVIPNPIHPRSTYQPHIPPAPRLQTSVTAKTDITAFRKHEDSVLNTYGWVNPEKGIVRVPIERAIELTLKNGLSTGVSDQGALNKSSGKVMR